MIAAITDLPLLELEPIMKKLDAESPETKSADIVAGNVEALKALFPDAFTEGKIDFEVLKGLLGAAVDERDEKYGLNWHGKRRARQIALTPSTGTLLPCTDESVDWDKTQNLMIEGDNLEVLKLLQKSYAGKVKLIYIDPPYNTGKDFVYPDDFSESIKNYLELTGQIDGGRKISSNTEASGRFHTDWLNMMYPRLKLARSLLSEDGSIWISIDSTELDALSSVLKEIFGPENFIGSFIWEKRLSRENRKVFSVNHDYILCCTKSRTEFEQIRGSLPLTEEARGRYGNPDQDLRGDWQSVAITAQAGHGTKSQFYTITTPSGRTLEPPPGNCWRFTAPRLKELIEDNRIYFGASGNNVPRQKLFLSEQAEGLTPHTLWSAEEVGTTDSAKRAINELFDGRSVYDTPKPVGMISRIIQIAMGNSGTVLDFFAGSGTTGHSTMAQNAANNANLRYVLVQLPEPLSADESTQAEAVQYCDNNKMPRVLSEITKDRLRRSAKKVRAENPLFAGDTGFRVFKLAPSNIRAWEPDAADLENSLLKNAEHLVQGRKEQDVLYELLLKLGLDLCVPIEAKTIAGKSVHSIGGGALIVCLADGLTKDVIESLASGIVAWRAALAPAVDTRVVFKDSGFADDIAKTNMAAILNQNGITDVRSL